MDVLSSQNGVMPVSFFSQSSIYSVSVSRVGNKLYFDTEDYQYTCITIWNYILQIYSSFAVFVDVDVNAKPCRDYVDLLRTCFGILTSEDKEVSENLNPFKYSWCSP